MMSTPALIAAARACADAHDRAQREPPEGGDAALERAWCAANASTVELLLVLAEVARDEWDPDLAYGLLTAAYAAANGDVDPGGLTGRRVRAVLLWHRLIDLARSVVRRIDEVETYRDGLVWATRAAFRDLAQRATDRIVFLETADAALATKEVR